jgi:ABC-type multidrug transport system ATPase subunit
MSDLFVDPNLTGVQTLELMKYLATLPNDKREEVAAALMKIINL